ncbi:MAG TPA: FxsA family protein, partial [Pilimelia sp.]|nr:FxsA family protein [Pilimelia sp.]
AGVRRYAERRLSPAAAGGLFGPRRVRVRTDRPAPGAGPDDAAPSSGPRAPIEGEIVER